MELPPGLAKRESGSRALVPGALSPDDKGISFERAALAADVARGITNWREGHMCLGIPGQIVEIRDDAGLRMGVVDFGGVRREVCLAYLDEDTRVGDYAVVHVGFAISRVDEEEAMRTFALLEEMGELEELRSFGEAAPQAGSSEDSALS